jgi:uncharacterized protein YdaU (DUF1376 family)
MSQAPIMPFYTDAYLADTCHLSAEVHGAYMLLLLHMWRMNGATLPDDDVQLARIARMSVVKWRKIRPQLEPFFTIQDGGWQQKKLLKTWLEVQERIGKQRENALKGVEKKKRQSASNPLQTQQSSSATAQPSINQHPLAKEDSLAMHGVHAQKEAIHQASLQSNYGVALHLTLPCPNISFLSPHIQDYRYFVTRGARKPVDTALRPRLEAAMKEVEQLLVIPDDAWMGRLVARIFRHCPAVRAEHRAPLQEDYRRGLSSYPKDMLELVVDKVLYEHIAAYPPLLSRFITLLEPQWKQRQYIAKQVRALFSVIS